MVVSVEHVDGNGEIQLLCLKVTHYLASVSLNAGVAR